MILTNGQRAGFFIGDGAGVGKGRQVCVLGFLDQVNLVTACLRVLVGLSKRFEVAGE